MLAYNLAIKEAWRGRNYNGLSGADSITEVEIPNRLSLPAFCGVW
ncbi:MAG: hypothetical protein ACXV76_13990 [Halobacteriota archaeon]